MATWYVDPVNGTDADASAGNGDSFATRRKSLTRIVAAAVAPGDTIRMIASPGPTSLGVNGTWTDGPYGTAVGITSSTNASPIVITLGTSEYTTLSPAVGDTVRITGHSTNTNANGIWEISAVNGSTTVTLINGDGSNSTGNGAGGADGTIRKINSLRVKLASAVTKNICLTGNKGTKTNWTASANVTCTVNTTDYKEGVESQQIAIAAGFTTGMAAYVALAGATNFSAYKQVSFWIKQTAGTTAVAGDITLTLCSDAAGATPVDTIAVPALGANDRWTRITVDTGGALGASIQSVALNVATDRGAQTFLIDNIIACKDSTANDSLTGNSVIGKNTTNEPFLAIQSINDVRIMLDQDTATTPLLNAAQGYFGTTATTTAYKIEPLPTDIAAAAGTVVQQVMDSGTSGSPITISGGWNRTDMSTQTGITWLDGRNGNGYGIFIDEKSYITLSKISTVRYYTGVYFGGLGLVFDAVSAVACQLRGFAGIAGNGVRASVLDIGAACSSSTGMHIAPGYDSVITVGSASGNVNEGIRLETTRHSVLNIGDRISGNINYNLALVDGATENAINGGTIAKSNTSVGAVIFSDTDIQFNDVTFSGNSLGSIYPINNSARGKVYLNRCTLSDSTEFYSFPTATSFKPRICIYSQNHDNTADNHLIKTIYGTITSEASVRHTAAGISWKLSPTDAYCGSYAPLSLAVASVQCASGVAKTVSLWMRRTNTGLTARLMCKGRQIAGVASDVSTEMTAAADTWEQVSINFTPTETGVVEITAECWGGTTYSLYVDDVSVA